MSKNLANNPSSDPTFDEKLQAFKEMVSIFKFERIVFVSVSVIAIIVLISLGFISFFKKDYQLIGVTGMFGSSGAVWYSCGKILTMWEDAMELLGLKKTKKKDGKPAI